jgi:hypothetical protein
VIAYPFDFASAVVADCLLLTATRRPQAHGLDGQVQPFGGLRVCEPII